MKKIALLIGLLFVSPVNAADLPIFTPPPIEEVPPQASDLREYQRIPEGLAEGVRYYLGYAFMAKRISEVCEDIQAFDPVVEDYPWTPASQLRWISPPLSDGAVDLVIKDAKDYSAVLARKLAPQPIETRAVWCQVHGNPLFEEALRVLDSAHYYPFVDAYTDWARTIHRAPPLR